MEISRWRKPPVLDPKSEGAPEGRWNLHNDPPSLQDGTIFSNAVSVADATG
jgi:hypothetical protein